jgi:nondiscriminating glutamyl-tRNA synthetase
VVDDHDMQITHVIRAEEHLTNTHRQVLIYRAMQWPEPQFAHVSLILGPDRSKLSKRHGATSVSQYAEDGFLPDAMFNYLTLLGWSSPDGAEVFNRDDAAKLFSLDRVNSAPAVFDHQKLEWMNGQYLHALPSSELRGPVSAGLQAAGLMEGTPESSDSWVDAAIELVKKSAHKVPDIAAALSFIFQFDAEAILADADNRAVLQEEGVPELLLALEEDLRTNGAPLDADAYQELTNRLKEKTGAKGKKLFMPLRIATTGSTHGPELKWALPLLEKGSRIEGLGPIVSPLARVETLNKFLQSSWI